MPKNKMRFMGAVVFLMVLVPLSVSCNTKASKVALDKSMIGTQAVCPVTGDTFTIHERTPVVQYRGKEYYMCCPGCDTEFMKAPDEYMKNTKETPSSSGVEQEIDYWTCSMHPEIKAEQEGNCPICGMVLIPAYKRAASDGQLSLSERDIALTGIVTTPVTKRHIYKEIRAVGKVAYDPELVTAQEEYVSALQTQEAIMHSDSAATNRMHAMVENAEYKLRLLGMESAEIADLKETRRGQMSLVMPENETWVYVDVYEPDISWIRKGQDVLVTSIAYEGERFAGIVKSISPLINVETHSATVRIRLLDNSMRLKPGMYVNARIMAAYMPSAEMPHGSGSRHEILVIPRESVLDTGNRKLVWVYLGDGQFQPREVRLGPDGLIQGAPPGERYYPVLDGLRENELVVTNGNFLLDSESRITGVAAIGYGGAMGIEEDDRAPQVHQH